MRKTKKIRVMNEQAFTLMELMAAVAVIAIISAVSVSAFSGPIRQYFELERKSDFHRQMAQAVQIVKRMGRLSSSCTKVTVGGSGFECNDYPRSSDVVRLILPTGSTNLSYRKRVGATNNWTELMTFPNVTEFKTCNETENVDHTCGLQPALDFDSSGTTTPTPRFFRFRITGQTKYRVSYQGSFFVRNPVLSNPTIAYSN